MITSKRSPRISGFAPVILRDRVGVELFHHTLYDCRNRLKNLKLNTPAAEARQEEFRRQAVEDEEEDKEEKEEKEEKMDEPMEEPQGNHESRGDGSDVEKPDACDGRVRLPPSTHAITLTSFLQGRSRWSSSNTIVEREVP
jgi:hypothetical protein